MLQLKTSASIRERVQAVRIRQYERYGREICNGRVSYELLLKTSPPSDKTKTTYDANIYEEAGEPSPCLKT
ncbi:hypothetical protein [Robertmurraya andreesenii]|uniref:ATPase with chaperone activity n=1 Tax=Anoxybacillus andreesenii TaxID=1325932 RepID=A0ABT9V004_9BACL|nr:hypothetical protein [Robertmurraya andreesenii]MDQ0154232.1 putative ATPase with chaperone activity [Robertmurraya andreesenii]